MGKKPRNPNAERPLGFLTSVTGLTDSGQIEGLPSLILGVEGEKISPSSFDVLPTLEFVRSFLALMAALADFKKTTLSLTGLQIMPGSAAWSFHARESQTPFVQRWAEESATLLMMKEVPAHFRPKVRDAREAISHLPANHHAYIQVKNERRLLPADFPTPDIYRETTLIRARIELAGGKNPFVRVSTEEGGIPILSLKTKQSLAQRAGKHLYHWVDAVVHLTWEGSSIQEAELDDFVVVPELEPEDEIRHWKDWFAKIGKHWEEVDDVEGALDCEDDQ